MTILFTKKIEEGSTNKKAEANQYSISLILSSFTDNQCGCGVVNLFCQCRNRCNPKQLAYKLVAAIVTIFILAKQSDNLIIERMNTSSRLTLKMSSSQLLLAISNPPDIISNGIILKLYHRVSHIYIV